MNISVADVIDLRIAATTIKFQDFADKIGRTCMARFNFDLIWATNTPNWSSFMDQSALATGLKIALKLDMIDANNSKHTINLFEFKKNSDFKRSAGIDGAIDSDAINPKNNVLSARITIPKMTNGENYPLNGKNEIWFIIPETFAAFGTEMTCEVQGYTEYN